MDEHTRPLARGRQEQDVNDQGQMGRVNRVDSLDLASRRPRNEPRFVHPEQFEDNANVWGFVIAGQAFTTENLSVDEVVAYIDRVFAGEQNPTLPVVSYEVTHINGEAIDAAEHGENTDPS